MSENTENQQKLDFTPKKDKIIPQGLYCLPGQALLDLSNLLNDGLPARFGPIVADATKILSCSYLLSAPAAEAAAEAAPEASSAEEAPIKLEDTQP